MLNWVNQFNIFCYLDNQQYKVQPQEYECLLAAGAASFINSDNSFKELDHFIAKPHWKFGHLSYSLKNYFFGLSDTRPDNIGFPPFFFFSPQILLTIRQQQLHIEADEPDIVYRQIMQQENRSANGHSSIQLKQRLSKDTYVNIIQKLQQHILRGDCYEINFCQEFFAEEAVIDVVSVFSKLSNASPTPFTAFYRLHDQYLLCASPERFLSRQGNKILSQPMKGTARRYVDDPVKDEEVKQELYKSAKERAENVMVVDLVRNDLSKVCKEASVKVDELFGIYTYPQVHQMISTVSGELEKDVSFFEIIAATFPMGSMTGAPKQRVLSLIDEYETIGRGLFSGSVGYINPTGDFDFNVVIRSIFFNAANKYLSYQVGSGITFYSDAEKEWEECLLKGEVIKKVLMEEST